MSITLYVATKEALSLQQALTAFGREAVGLFYAPGWCGFGAVAEDGTATGSGSRPLPLENVYEARVFTPDAELRWWNDPKESKHRVALLSEQATNFEGAESKAISVMDTLKQSYLLWGQATDSSSGLAPGWTRLTTARIGKLDVPKTGGKQFVLHAVEYLTEFPDGNLAVADERLTGLTEYREQS